jgi:hypothetical protein
MAITKVINDAVDLNQTTDYSGLRLPVGTTGNVVESFTTDYLVVGGGGSGSLQGAGGAGGLRTSYNNSTTTTNTLSFPSGKTAIATYMLDNNATDLSENYNGAETNITYNTGQYGGAAVFNGSSSEITASSFASLSQVGISMWVNMPNISQQAGLIARYGSTREFAIYMYGGTLIASIYYNGNNGNATIVTASTYMSNNTWHHIAYTANGSTAPKLYIDGSEVGTPQYTDAARCAYYTSSEPLDIGHFAGVAAYNYEGLIDQVRIYDAALSSTDVTNIYNNEVQANSGGGTAAESSLTLSAGTAYDVTVGAGGIDTYTSGGSSGSGANSIFSTITSTGGGGAGATSSGAGAASGKNGGSGGGAGANTGGSPGSGTLGQGYIGGTALFYFGSYAGGGGGGALGAGGNTTSNTVAGNGGAQLNLAITGNSVGYAGGGGGSLYGTGTVGTNDSSAGAAAPSGSSSANGESAPFNLGGGGGGSNHISGTTNITGGAGGSGVVILRYPTASVSSFTTTGTLNTPSTTDTIADTAYPVANTAYYKLDNSAIDLSGSTGKFDQGGVFNGSSSYISTGIPIDSYSSRSYSFWFKIDQVRIFNTALTQSQITTLARGIGTSYSGVDTNVSYAYNGTPTNVTYENGRFNKAAIFNGSSSRITLPIGSPFNDSNTIKAISAWIKAGTSTSRVYPLSISSTSNANDYWYIGYMGDLNAIYVATRDGSSSNQSIAYATITPDTGWHHIVVQLTATGKEIYLDGISQTITNSNSGTATNTSWINYPSYSGTVQGAIGVLRLASISYGKGSIDQIRIFETALSDTQVTQLYNEHYQTKFTDGSDTAIVFTQGTGTVTFSGVDPAPPQGALRANTSYSEDGSGSVIEHYNGTDWKYFDAIKYCTTNTLNFPSGAGCIASYNFNNNVNDIGNTYNGVNSNVTFNASGKFGAAAVFNGSNARIDISGVLTGFTNVYSFSIWAKIPNTDNFSFIRSNTNTTNQTNLIGFALHQNGNYYFDYGNVTTGRLTGSAPTAWRNGNWHNFVFVSSSTQKLVYVDGVLFDSKSSTASVSSLNTVTLGYYGSNYANGSMDQLRIFNDSLTSDEVAQLYNNEIACS